MIYDAYATYEDIEIKHCQVVYLHNKNVDIEIIMQVTEYAKCTISNYYYKYSGLLQKAISLFEIPAFGVYYTCANDLPADSEKFYLLEAYDENKDLMFSKVGTTARPMQKRMAEHMQYYGKRLGVTSIRVLRVWDCGNLPAECFESFFRAYYIKKYSKAFCKNDRFFNVRFDLKEADRLFSEWINFSVEN